MRKFEHCDVLSVLREIMSHNTKHYQTDFAIDEEILTEAANEPNAWDRRFLWMSRPCGTHCLKEKDVFLFNSPEYSTWTAYAATADEIVAYAVQLNGYEDGVLKGDLYELDYASHCAKAKNSAVYIAQIKLHCGDRDIIMAYSDAYIPYLSAQTGKLRQTVYVLSSHDRAGLCGQSGRLRTCLYRGQYGWI